MTPECAACDQYSSYVDLTRFRGQLDDSIIERAMSAPMHTIRTSSIPMRPKLPRTSIRKPCQQSAQAFPLKQTSISHIR